MFNFDDFEILEYHPTGLHVYEPILTVNEKKYDFWKFLFYNVEATGIIKILFRQFGKV